MGPVCALSVLSGAGEELTFSKDLLATRPGETADCRRWRRLCAAALNRAALARDTANVTAQIMGDTDARRAAAELQTRRGLEDSVRLLDEQLSHATQRAELEAKHRREAERRVAHVEAEMASLRTEMSATFGAIQTGEGDRHDRELRERAANHRLDAALGERAALEATVQELRGESEVLAQRLEAEARARASLTEQLAATTREIDELRARLVQQRQASAESADAYRAVELAHREAARRAEDAHAEAAETADVLREARAELELLQRRHQSEVDARHGQQAAEQLRMEELSEARRATEVQSRLVAELQQAESTLASTVHGYRTQLQNAVGSNAELHAQFRSLTQAADEAAAKAAEAERARESAVASAARAADEVRELRTALDASATRERRGEGQRADLQESNGHLRTRLEEETRARTALDDALRLRAATRAAQPLGGGLQARPADDTPRVQPMTLGETPFKPPSSLSAADGGNLATGTGGRVAMKMGQPAAEALPASARLLASDSLLRDTSIIDEAKVLTGYEEPPSDVATGGISTRSNADAPAARAMLDGGGEDGALTAEDGAVSLERYKHEMRLHPRASPFEPQLRAVREALAAEGRPAPPAASHMSAFHVPAAEELFPSERLPGASTPMACGGGGGLSDSPLESRKRELSEELKRLKARLQPMGQAMGPPPPRPPARAPTCAAAAGDGVSMPPPRAPVNSCDPACSPAGAGARAAALGTPATHAGAAADSAAPTPKSPVQPEHGPFGRSGGISGFSSGALPSSSAAAAAGGGGFRHAALGELEESQKMLEEKLAALKRKMEE